MWICDCQRIGFGGSHAKIDALLNVYILFGKLIHFPFVLINVLIDSITFCVIWTEFVCIYVNFYSYQKQNIIWTFFFVCSIYARLECYVLLNKIFLHLWHWLLLYNVHACGFKINHDFLILRNSLFLFLFLLLFCLSATLFNLSYCS